MKYAFFALAAIAAGSLSACHSAPKKCCSSTTVIQQDGKAVQAPVKSCCKKN